ncbi:aconitate hydratase AcnA [Rhodoferax sp. 4810]|uniref:Aconitate hydratase n=1 Tax=Thiospirillum jenense TaxID=1653858 RepID=A0A839HDB0_9GAMM|nr:aconitate hydratase AcnA [Thiospirillum jenense]MBB1073807.1 aconitate hydratase AcnA [Rhodoferax jenense]MBB1125238.1 aconitate hydratase AcnA [Thiospirillum jenense]
MLNSFNTRATLTVADQHYTIHRLADLPGAARLPFALQILLENLLRCEDGVTVRRADIEALLNWDATAEPDREIQFRPARVLMQDFTGVPAVVDLAAMRDALRQLGGDPARINPLSPAELVIDHSIQVDYAGDVNAAARNTECEFARNQERYQFLKWGQSAFANFQVVPPGNGIIHQINVEHLARVVFAQSNDGQLIAYPDTVVGTDSHTTMINGLGVLGWGVGGIEAEAALLGQPISMLIPKVVGVELTGQLSPGTTATDLVLTLVERLRQHGVVGKLVEFYGPAVANLPMGERTTIANMAPEYGATCGIFPLDAVTIAFLRLSGRPESQIALVEQYARAQNWFGGSHAAPAVYSEGFTFDLGSVVPSLAGPKRPQDRVALVDLKTNVNQALAAMHRERGCAGTPVSIAIDGQSIELRDGALVIAAITSCTNTSNPSVLFAAGLLAHNAVARGLMVPAWVKTSLAPGSQVATRALAAAGLLNPLETLGFHVVGYGCTTCIGNSGPLNTAVSNAINDGQLTVAAVLSGNRNFEGRVHAEVRLNYLASPPLVVAYAIAGRIDIDLINEPLGNDKTGQPVYLRDIWPNETAIQQAMTAHLSRADFIASYADVFRGEQRWQQLAAPTGQQFAWDVNSTYIQQPPYFKQLTLTPAPLTSIHNARCLAVLGDSVTTDHISPAGNIKRDSPAGRYLLKRGVQPSEFNSYGARRGNHEIMMRGTFANIRLRNQLAPGTEGGVTRHQPSGELLTIYDAAMRYQLEQVPVIIIAGKEYGSGSSRDWAAKGPQLLGVRAVIAESYERIHRTNLVCMGILPLQFMAGDSAAQLGLTGEELFSIPDLTADTRQLLISATTPTGAMIQFNTQVRIDTPNEWEYYQHGGILPYVVRRLAMESN